MDYVDRQMLFEARYDLRSDGLHVDVSGRFRPNECFFIPRSMCSSAVGHTELRDRTITTLIQLAFMLCFIAVVVVHVAREAGGLTLWLGMAITLAGMVFGSLLSPKRRLFTIHSSSAVPIVTVSENPGTQGREQYDHFIAEYMSWVEKHS